MTSPDQLTTKQEAFCLAYLEAGNASEAYRRAYDAGRMKAETINRKAKALMDDGKIAARIGELRAAVAKRTVISEVRVIEETARIGLFDPARLFDEEGALLPIQKMPEDVRAAIASIEFDDAGRVKKVKAWDKNSALEKIMRHLGSFERDNRQRATLFDGVSRDTVWEIAEKLRGLKADDSRP